MLSQWSQPVVWPLVFSFLVALVLVPAAGSLARRFGFVAHPRDDRWHRRPIALSGGIAIACTVLAGVIVFQLAAGLALLLTVCALMFVTGLLDDLFGLKPFSRLVVEIGIASILLSFGYRLNWTTSLTLDTILTLVWVVGMTNAFNLLDHMDGLCAGIALIVGAGLMAGLVAAPPGTEAFFQMQYLAVLLGAIAGFLVFNRHPASIFMGDSGALVLGLSFAALTLRHVSSEPAQSNPLAIVAAPVLVLLIPIFDTTLVTASRLLAGRAPSQGGRDHSSHRLVALGLSEPAAVGVLWLLAAVGGAFGVGIDYFNLSWSSPMAALFLIAMAIFAVFLSRIGVYEDDKDAGADPARRTPLVVDFMYKKQVVEVILDLALATIAYYSSYRLRFEGDDFAQNFQTFYRTLPLVAAMDVLALFAVGFYRGVWRYFGLMDTVVVAKGVLLGTGAALFCIEYVMDLGPHSHSVFVIDMLLVTTLLTGSRVSFRLIGEFLRRHHHTATRVVIYGAGVGGALVARELAANNEAPFRIVGFADDDPAKQGRRVQGYQVIGGHEAVLSLVRSGSVDTVVVSARLIDLDRLQAVQAVCGDHGVNVLRWRVGLEPVTKVGT